MRQEDGRLPALATLNRSFTSKCTSDLASLLARGALAFLEILLERHTRLLEMFAHELQGAWRTHLQLRPCLRVDAHAGPAQLVGSEGYRGAFHRMNQILEHVVLLGFNCGLHLPQKSLPVLYESVDELRHEAAARADQLELRQSRRVDDHRVRRLGALERRSPLTRPLDD